MGKLPNLMHVQFVESRTAGSLDTMTTIQNRLMLFGAVQNAMQKYTRISGVMAEVGKNKYHGS